MSSKINLGIIGLSAANSWASNAHYPYLKDSDKYRIAAISNSKLESSEAAAEKYDIPREHAHASADSIAADHDVNLVVVSVKVPYHKQLLLPAIKAKKDVFSEWPLGANLKEAQEIAHLAQEAGVRTMVGLQARQDVAINEAKKLVDSGKLGEILSTSFMGYGLAWTDIADESSAYLYDIKNGATLTTIPSGHSLDAMCYVLGEFESVSATAIVRTPKALINDGTATREIEKTAHDHLAITGTLQSGAIVSFIMKPGAPAAKGVKGLYWEIVGKKGVLILEGSGGHIQMLPPTLHASFDGGDLIEIVGPKEPTYSYNVGRAYENFAKNEGGYPTFEDAVVRHKLIDAIEESARTGERKFL